MRGWNPILLEWQPAGLDREYDTLLERCGSGVLVIMEDGQIRRANKLGLRLLGLPPEALSIAGSPLGAEIRNLISAAVDRQEADRVEARGPDGSHLILSLASVLDSSGQPGGFMVIIHDVTDLRRLEKIRRDFVANVSHELRTPLASIRAMAETLQDGALEDGSVSDHFLGTIIKEAQRLTRISEDLLVLSDAESRLPEKSPLDLSELIGLVLNRFQPQAERAGVGIEGSVAERLVVEANRDQIEQVLVNLIDNAIKYTPSGGSVHVTAEREGDRAAVHVADTGIGIEGRDLPRIFERFYRVDKARSRQSGGTGLGLSIVKHIVESHGGQVTVESEKGRGSQFTFVLPILDGLPGAVTEELTEL